VLLGTFVLLEQVLDLAVVGREQLEGQGPVGRRLLGARHGVLLWLKGKTLARPVPRFWHALCESHGMSRILFATMACVMLAILALGGCDRPYDRVSAPAEENLSRNVSVSPPPPPN